MKLRLCTFLFVMGSWPVCACLRRELQTQVPPLLIAKVVCKRAKMNALQRQ